MKKSLIIVLSLLMAAMFLFAGCSSSKNESISADMDYYAGEASADSAYPQDAPMMDEKGYDNTASDGDYGDYVEEDYDEGGSASLGIDQASSILEPSVDRKIIYSGNISARTKNFDEDYQNIIDKVKEAGGYIENAYVYGTKPEEWQDEGRYAEITLRVPSSKFDSFIQMLEGVGQTTNSSVSGRDISVQYYDIESRLENLRIREDRLQELLEKAASLEDIIELERELANVSYEIESYETEKRNYDSLIDFSQIYVSLQEVAQQAEIAPPEESLGESIKNGFYNVLNGLAVFGRWFVIAIVSISPVLIVLAVILAVVLLSVRAARKRKAKKMQMNSTKQENK